MKANTLYSDFIDRDTTNTLKNNKVDLDYISYWANVITEIGADQVVGCYIFVGDNDDVRSMNFMSDNFNLTHFNSPTINANGIEYNGSTQYSDTGISPLTHLEQNTCFLGFFNRENTNLSYRFPMGIIDPSTSTFSLSYNYASFGSLNSLAQHADSSLQNLDKYGLRLCYRSNSTQTRNLMGDNAYLHTNSSITPSSQSITLGKAGSSYAALKTNFAIIGNYISHNDVKYLRHSAYVAQGIKGRQ